MAGRICRESQSARSGGTFFCQSFSQKPPFFGGFWGPKMRLCSGLAAGSLMRPRKRGRVVWTPGTMESANWMCLYMYGSLTRLFSSPVRFFIPRPFNITRWKYYKSQIPKLSFRAPIKTWTILILCTECRTCAPKSGVDYSMWSKAVFGAHFTKHNKILHKYAIGYLRAPILT